MARPTPERLRTPRRQRIRTWLRGWPGALAASIVIGSAALLASASPASASVVRAAAADSFTTYTTDNCGAIQYVDDGDYFVLHDYCSDSHGVRAQVTITFEGYVEYYDSRYDPNGLAGDAFYWYTGYDVVVEDKICVTVGLVDGASDTSFSKPRSACHTSSDG
jgi:hypothetical protein